MLFNRFSLDLENAKYLFPHVFDYYQTEENKSPILSLCQSELDEGKIQSKKLEPQRENLMTYLNILCYFPQDDAF